jgi:hypothetical protein
MSLEIVIQRYRKPRNDAIDAAHVSRRETFPLVAMGKPVTCSLRKRSLLVRLRATLEVRRPHRSPHRPKSVQPRRLDSVKKTRTAVPVRRLELCT